jgi:hypothetical protein
LLVSTLLSSTATAQESLEMAGMEGGAFDSCAPMTESGGGEFFSQELGTLLRLRYSTESYGQDRRGNFDVGTMRIENFEDAIAFFDGQVTLSDVNGVGYNLGVGFRWLGWAPFPSEPERITGFSLWTDGTSTESGSFFPQIGVSYESLGEMWDFRANGYIPLGTDTQIGAFTPTGDIVFSENFLVLEALADQNKSFNVGEIEFARRIMHDRDAWGFAGGYALANNEEDTAGYRLGFRGYAYPDLLLQLAVTNDDIFATNAAFSVTWFVGRTRTNFQPACGLVDRMREPVMRNDYVALKRTTVTGGEPLTNTDGEAFRFVHVNSAAPAGGDGTYENPLNNVGNVEGNSQVSDIVLLYANSVFNGQSTLVAQDEQRLLGEGNGEIFTIDTEQAGIVDIPETSPGARDGARAIISGAVGSGAVRLADANEVANFNIDGTGTAAGVAGVFSPATGAGNPNIHDMDFSNVTGTGIQFTPLTRTDPDDASLKTVAGNVTIDNVNFDDMAGIEIDINSATTEDVTDPNVTLLETIAISNVDSQNGANRGVWLRNTHDNRTATILNYTNGTLGTAGSGGGLGGVGNVGVLVFEGTAANQFDGNVTLTNIDIFENLGYALDMGNIDPTSAFTLTTGNGLTYDGGGGAAGGMRFNNFNGTFTGASSTLTQGTLSGVTVTGTSDGTINLASTVTFDSIDPGTDEAVINVGPTAGDSFTGVLTVSGDVTDHDTGRLVSIQRMTDSTASVTLGGDMTDVANGGSTGIFISNNTDGTILFTGDLRINTTSEKGIEIVANNDNVDINFNGLVDITTDGIGAEGFDASGGGTLTLLGTTNTITSNGSTALTIEDMVISNGGVNFGVVNATGGTNGIRLVDNDGTGSIVIGATTDEAPDAGLITGTTAEGILIENTGNVAISGIQVDATAGQSGVHVHKDTTGTQIVDLNNLVINGGDIGIEVTGNGTGTLNMTVNDSEVLDSTARAFSVDNIDTGSIAVNGTTFDGNNTGATAGGVLINGSNASFTFDDTTVIQEFGGTDFEVDGDLTGTATVSFAGDIVNSSTTNPGDTTGRSVHIHDIDGGSITFTAASSIDDNNEGMLVEDNSGGTVSFLGTNTFDMSGTNDAVTLADNDVGGTNTSITFASLEITTMGASSDAFLASGGGTVSVTGTSNTITTTGGRALDIQDMTLGSIDFESIDATGGATPVLLANNLTGTVTIGDTGNAVGDGGTISDATVAGIRVTNTNVTLNGVIVQNSGDGAGENGVEILHTNATAMNANLNRLTVENTNAGVDGVVIDGTGGTGTFNSNIQNLDVNVEGDGLLVDEGVTLTAGGTNTIESTTGVGLSVTDSTIAGAGATFRSVSVSNGATVGINLQNLTGGALSVTGIGTTDGSGGTLNTTGDAIVVTNAPNVSLSNIDVTGAANAVAVTKNTTAAMTTTLTNVDVTSATGDGINTNVTSSGVFNLTINDADIAGVTGQGFDLTAGGTATDVNVVVDQMTTTAELLATTSNNVALDYRVTNSTIDAATTMNINSSGNFDMLLENSALTTTGTTNTVVMAFGVNAQDGDVIIRNNTTFDANDGAALLVTANGTNANIDFMLSGNDMSNSNAQETVDVAISGGATFNATVVNNTLANTGGDELFMESDGSTTRVDLNLDNNNAGAGGMYHLLTSNNGGGFNFGVEDRDNADANNVGTINFDPAIGQFEDISSVPTPVLP